MRIAVAGATGSVGHHVVAVLAAAGHQPVGLTRAQGVDLTRSDGLTAKLEGVDAVIDVSATTSLRASTSRAFFGAVTRNLLLAEAEAGVGHHVALSIVGAAHVNAGYYAGKAAQEALVRTSGQGWSLLRTTQFYEFVQQTITRGSLAGLVLAPQMRCQPIAAVEVAHALAELVGTGPRGVVPDLAGPQEEHLHDLVRRYLRSTGRHAPVLAVPVPGRIGRAMRRGDLLPAVGVRRGRQTFDEWLTTARTRW